jgi:hypothetical protein
MQPGTDGGFRGAVAVVPTRNRPDLAMNAIRSLLDGAGDELHVLVSDNSTSDGDAESLRAYCAQVATTRLTYVRPPEPLAMTPHWEWALSAAMTTCGEASHFLFLTDRMMFRDRGVAEIVALARHYPDRLVAYNHDRIVDDRLPIRIQEYASTGQLLELDSNRIIWLYSQCYLFNAFPRMLNCIVPRRLLDSIRAAFGTVFASIAPDLSLCCRALHVEAGYLFYDKSVMFHYALGRSHGATLARGDVSAASADFERNLTVDPESRNHATPIPQLNTAHNAVINEYLVHREATRDPRFGPIEMKRYLDVNAWEVAEMTESGARARNFELLRQAGYEGPVSEPSGQDNDDYDPRPRFDDVAQAIDWARLNVTGGPSVTQTFHEMLNGRPLPLPAALISPSGEVAEPEPLLSAAVE